MGPPTTRDGSSARATGEVVTGSYFPLLGVQAAVGRLLGPPDDVAPGAHPVVVLGHGYWKRGFGGDSGVIGNPVFCRDTP